MNIWQLTKGQKEILDDALWSHQYSMDEIRNDPSELDNGYCSAFDPSNKLAGEIASVSLFNLMNPLIEQLTASGDDKSFVVGTTTIKSTRPKREKGPHLATFGIYPEGHSEDYPKYVLDYQVENEEPNKRKLVSYLLRPDVDDPDEYEDFICKGIMMERRKRDGLRRSYGDAGRFAIPSEMTYVFNLLKPVLEGESLLSVADNEEQFINGDAIDLVNVDGGIAGDLSNFAISLCRNELLHAYAPAIAARAKVNQQALVDSGKFWNQSKMSDERGIHYAFALPSSDPKRQAYVHEDISLISDFTTQVVVVDSNDIGEVETLSIFAINRFKKGVVGIANGLLRGEIDRTPDIQYDLKNKQIMTYSDACSDLLIMANSQTVYEMELIADGRHKEKSDDNDDFECYYPEEGYSAEAVASLQL